MGRRDPNELRVNNYLNEAVTNVFDSLGKALCYGGGGIAAVGILMLLYHFFGSAGADTAQIEAALKYQDYFRQMALWGFLATSIGSAWLFWGEEVSGPILLIVGLLLALMTWWVPLIAPNQANELQANALQYLATAGYPGVIVGFILIIADVVTRSKIRLKEGAKAEQMKYGKGMREERDTRNVFFGKCWQLPYCRKFVRERCPIYHAKRTCWKERVGCMCEEGVIKTAMEGGPISKDLLAASKFIPKNHTLSAAAKAERCRQCVIYNEHQKHKYQLFMPIAFVSVVAIYITMRPVLAEGIQSALSGIDKIYTSAALSGNANASEAAKATSVDGGAIAYNEIILFVLALVALAYAIKFIEYLVWKLKI